MNRILSLSVWTALLLGLTACNKPADSAASNTSDSATGTASGGGRKPEPQGQEKDHGCRDSGPYPARWHWEAHDVHGTLRLKYNCSVSAR